MMGYMDPHMQTMQASQAAQAAQAAHTAYQAHAAHAAHVQMAAAQAAMPGAGGGMMEPPEVDVIDSCVESLSVVKRKT